MTDDELATSLSHLLESSDAAAATDEPDIEARIRRLVGIVADKRLAVPGDIIDTLGAWRGWRTYDDYLDFAYNLARVKLHSPSAGKPIVGDGEELYWPFLALLKSHGVDTGLGELAASTGEFGLALADICWSAAEAEQLDIPSDLADLLVHWLPEADEVTETSRRRMSAAILRHHVDSDPDAT